MESEEKSRRRIKITTDRALDMEKLNSEMKLEIFSRLPVESVIRCRCVCKAWHSLLNDPHFINMHTQNTLLSQLNDDDDGHNSYYSSSSTVSSFIISVSYHVREVRTSRHGHTVRYGDYDDNLCSYKESKSNLMNLIYILVMKHAHVIGSCNGLVCLRTGTKLKDGDHNIVYNPVTKEAVNIPSDKLSDIETRITVGFGYHPSTKEYKIVSSRTRKQPNGTSSTNIEDVRVYTLGSGKWRNIDQDNVAAAYDLGSRSDRIGVHVNGSLYWITYGGSSPRHGYSNDAMEQRMIMSFDLGAEKFGMITTLPALPPRPSSLLDIDDRITPIYKLEESRGCLCLFFFYRPFDPTRYNHSFVYSEIWVMKKEKKKKKKSNDNHGNDTYTWSKVLERTGDHGGCLLTRFVALTKSGKVLFRHTCIEMFLSCFDPNTGSTASLREVSSRSPILPYLVVAIPHMKSFVSIKALGEENAGIMESFEYAKKITENFVSLEPLREEENAEIRKNQNKICFY